MEMLEGGESTGPMERVTAKFEAVEHTKHVKNETGPTISGSEYEKLLAYYTDENMHTEQKEYHQMANAIRFLSIDAIQAAKSGHPGLPMGMADVATVLFKDFMKFNPDDPEWQDRDRFVISNGHGSMLMYSLLYLTGYKDMTIQDIRNFRQIGSKAAGHPENYLLRGVETTTGPLGQGIANSVGMAIAEKILNAKYGDDICNHYTYAMCGDGCLMEGISQEAISFAAHQKLNKLIWLWDDNEITIDGRTSLATSEDNAKRFEAAGWHVQVIDGHNIKQIYNAIDQARKSDMPSMIACKTHIGFGAPTKVGSPGIHGAALGVEEVAGSRKKLLWDHEPFVVPEDILYMWNSIKDTSLKEYNDWTERYTSSPHQSELDRLQAEELPKDWQKSLDALLDKVCREKPNNATRKSSELVLQELSKDIPELLGGSADLTGSNLTKTKTMTVMQAENPSGQYIHYGIREFAMCAIMNGVALHKGLIPYGGTFLQFSDYCRHSIHMAALMKIRALFVMTHDSIGLGEDGPTHQPIEHLASFRAMPNIYTMRPCDTVETAECYKIALESLNTPTLLALSRQNLSHIRTTHSENLTKKGGYIIKASEQVPQVTIIATGSEVKIALECQEMLEVSGIPTNVVSMPCTELFDEQSRQYKEETLGSGLRVTIEALSTFGWHKYTGLYGMNFGIDTFGISAKYQDIYEHFGITAQKITPQIKERLQTY